MKKKQKKLKKKTKIIKKKSINKKIKRSKRSKKKSQNKIKKKRAKKIKNIKDSINAKKAKKDGIALKLVKLQLSLKPDLNFKITFSLEKYIQSFFDKISETIANYKILKIDEKRRQKLEKIERERKIKIALEKQKKEEEPL